MRCAALILVVGLLAAPSAKAAGVAGVAGIDGTDAAALRRIDAGIDAFRAGAYDAARREFEAARQLAPTRANPYRWLGLTEVKRGDCTQALLDFEMFLKLVPANDERVPEILTLRRQCEHPELLGSPPPAAAPGASTVVTPRAAPESLPPRAAAAQPGSSATPTEPRAGADQRPLSRRWWFWTSIGVATAAVALGVGLGVGLAPAHEPRFAPIACDATGCRAAGTP